MGENTSAQQWNDGQIFQWQIRLKRRFFWKRRVRVLMLSIRSFAAWLVGSYCVLWLVNLLSSTVAVGFAFGFFCILVALAGVGKIIDFFVPQRYAPVHISIPVYTGTYFAFLMFILTANNSFVAVTFQGGDGANFVDWLRFLADESLAVVLFDLPNQLFEFKLSNISINGWQSRVVVSGFRLFVLTELIGFLIGLIKLLRMREFIGTIEEVYNACLGLPHPADYSVRKISHFLAVDEPPCGADEFVKRWRKEAGL